MGGVVSAKNLEGEGEDYFSSPHNQAKPKYSL